jgi:hypothetical protein
MFRNWICVCLQVKVLEALTMLGPLKRVNLKVGKRCLPPFTLRMKTDPTSEMEYRRVDNVLEVTNPECYKLYLFIQAC